MKIPSTFTWLSAAVLTAALGIFAVSNLVYGRSHVTDPAPAAAPTSAPAPTAAKNKIQIAFLLDTSSSMDGLIDQAKARLWNILNELLKAERDGETPDIEVALYQYGNSSLLPEKGYIQQITPLTTDVDLFSDKLFGLTTGGGDEYCGQVVLSATDELKWSGEPSDVRLIYVAGNEPFDQGEVRPEDALRKARGKDITVNTILCGDPNGADGPTWRSGAKNGDGDFFFINQDEKVVYIPSPYDDAIELHNQQLNRTYVPINREAAVQQANQVRQDANAASYSKANLSSRAKYKASKKYKATWDLVDAAEADEESVLAQKESLPDSLKTLSNVQLKVKIATISEEREALRKELKALTDQREAYVAAEKKKLAGTQANTLGEKLKESVRGRLKAKQYKVKN